MPGGVTAWPYVTHSNAMDLDRGARTAGSRDIGDDDAMRLDEDFLRALAYGMPPSGGGGMGVDRVVMALTGPGIPETILFPLGRNRTTICVNLLSGSICIGADARTFGLEFLT